MTASIRARPQRFDSMDGKRGRDEPSEPGVVRWIDDEHVPRERRSGQPFGNDLAVGGERRAVANAETARPER